MPRITVAIPSYNHEKYVAKAIQSVLDQSYQDFELVITDDGSSDGTVSAINNFNDPRVRLFCFEKNRGASTAINNCIQKAEGEYIAILNSDDIFFPHKLEKQVAFLDNHPEVGAVFGYAQIIDDDGNDLGDSAQVYRNIFQQKNRTGCEWLNYFFWHSNVLCHSSVLIRKECYAMVGCYDERIAQLPDFDFWIRLCMVYEIHIISENLIKYRVRQAGANASGDRPDVRRRSDIESVYPFKHYLTITSKVIFLEVFPEGVKYKDSFDEELIPFYLCDLALTHGTDSHFRFAIDALFNLLQNIAVRRKIYEKYDFSVADFIQLTGKNDLLNTELVRDKVLFIESVTAQLQSTTEQLQSVTRELFLIKKTILWRLSRRAYVLFDHLFHPHSKAGSVLSEVLERLKFPSPLLNSFHKSNKENILGEKGRKKIAIYTGSNSQSCLYEIAELLRCGFEEIGMGATCVNEKSGFLADADWHIIIAACEFFYNTPEGMLRMKEMPKNSILFVLEQPHSYWYTQIEHLFKRAHALWSSDYATYTLMSEKNYKNVVFLPLGYSKEFNSCREIATLPNNSFTSFLDDTTKNYSFSEHLWQDRPIDVVIFCHLTERRNIFFATHSKIFSKYRCYFIFVNMNNGLVVAGDSPPPDSKTTLGIIQRSKILINIHRGTVQYFEWHRIIMQGIWSKTLVISEKCDGGPLFENEKDYIMCELNEIGNKVDFYLSSAGREKAQEIITSAYQKLTTRCRVSDFLKESIDATTLKGSRGVYMDVLSLYDNCGIDNAVLRQWSIPEDDWEIIDSELLTSHPKNVLEIGTFVGFSTFCIASRLIDEDQHLYTIDPNVLLKTEVMSVDREYGERECTLPGEAQDIAKRIFETFREGKNIHFLQGCLDYNYSNDGHNDLKKWLPHFLKNQMKFDFVFIDANHSSEAVLSDLNASAKILTDGGVILLHDGRGRWADEVLFGVCRFLENNTHFTVSRREHGTIIKLQKK